MRIGADGASETTAAVTPVVSTSGVKVRARKVTDVSGAVNVMLETLDLLDQMQTRGPDPRRLKANQGKPIKSKKWNGG